MDKVLLQYMMSKCDYTIDEWHSLKSVTYGLCNDIPAKYMDIERNMIIVPYHISR